MGMLSYQELYQKSATELTTLLHETKGQLTLFRFHNSAGQENNVRKSRALRKYIAMIHTALRQRNG